MSAHGAAAPRRRDLERALGRAEKGGAAARRVALEEVTATYILAVDDNETGLPARCGLIAKPRRYDGNDCLTLARHRAVPSPLRVSLAETGGQRPGFPDRRSEGARDVRPRAHIAPTLIRRSPDY